MLARFLRDDDGAITVDWVVLVAAVIGLTVAVMPLLNGGTQSLASEISTHLEEFVVEDI